MLNIVEKAREIGADEEKSGADTIQSTDLLVVGQFE
jgi:hypothetical protein